MARACPPKGSLGVRGYKICREKVREPETGRHFAPAFQLRQPERPEVTLRPARNVARIRGFSRDHRKLGLRRTARWSSSSSRGRRAAARNLLEDPKRGLFGRAASI